MKLKCYPLEYNGENPWIQEITLEQLGDYYAPNEPIYVIRNGQYIHIVSPNQPARKIAIRSK